MQKLCKLLKLITFDPMVPAAGLEPARRLSRGILSPLCLPIPPSGLSKIHSAYISIIFVLASRALNWLLLLLLNALSKIH